MAFLFPTSTMKKILLALGLVPMFIGSLSADEIKHRFLALDESRFQILYVDQFDATKSWTIPVPKGNRDLQLVDGKIIIGLGTGGFREYDFATQRMLREVVDPKYAADSVAACRLEDGRTILASAQTPIRITVLDAEGKELSSTVFPNMQLVRCVRFTPRGTVLFGCNANHIIEGTLDGKIIRDIEIPDARYVYMVKELANGNLVATSGFGGALVELNKEGKIIRKVGGKPGPEEVGIHFFASVDVLKNGNFFVANWTGHGANDSEKGVQLIEYNSAGDIVWRWHDAKSAGSIHNAIVIE